MVLMHVNETQRETDLDEHAAYLHVSLNIFPWVGFQCVCVCVEAFQFPTIFSIHSQLKRDDL